MITFKIQLDANFLMKSEKNKLSNVIWQQTLENLLSLSIKIHADMTAIKIESRVIIMK